MKSVTKNTKQRGRRGFLALLSGAIAVPAGAALPAAVAAAAASALPVIAEAPELLAIGERLSDMITRIHDVGRCLDEAYAAYERLKPAVPPEIIGKEGDFSLTHAARGVDNEPVHRGEGGGFLDLYSARKVKAYIAQHKIDGRTKEGRRPHRIARLAAQWEKDREAAIEASGYPAANGAFWDIVIELQDQFAKAALAFPPRTMKGIEIYAGIVVAGSGSGPLGRGLRQGRSVGYCEELAVAMARAFVAINCGGKA